MKYTRNLLLTALAAAVLIQPGSSCGPDWPEAIFVNPHHPDAPYADFAKGRIGVLQPGYRTRHLVIAYNYLTGRALNSKEQQQAVRVNQLLTDPWKASERQPRVPSGLDAWIQARSEFGKVDGIPRPDRLHDTE